MAMALMHTMAEVQKSVTPKVLKSQSDDPCFLCTCEERSADWVAALQQQCYHIVAK